MVSMEVLARATLLFLPLFFTVSAASLLGDLIFGQDSTKKPDYETAYGGGWELSTLNSGVSAMHMVLLNNNKAIIFDATVFGPSQVPLAPGNCRPDPTNKINKTDCWAHAVEFDIDMGSVRPLKILTDTWCSSGSVSADGTLVQTGGWNDGGKAVRYISPCDTCDWKEYPTALSAQRWYATQQILPDGNFIVIGGRRQFSFEFVPTPGQSNTKSFALPFLRQTTDEVENNLYPFVHLSTDGNLFILANNRSILLDYNANKILHEFPILPGGSRNYPASGMSVLLPLNLQDTDVGNPIPAEVLVCGGSPSISAKLSAKGTFLPALNDCGRITITDSNPTWQIETMPSARVMGDMLLLPNAQVLMINGAKKGTSGWGFAREPNLEPVLYEPGKLEDMRFTTLNPTTIPRMYHSTSAVLPDGRILVAGSNTNNGYNYTGVMYPTELRVENFWPPYLDPLLTPHRPAILPNVPQTVKYGKNFGVPFLLASIGLDLTDLQVTMYAPPFTTHGYSMNQRLIILNSKDFEHLGLSTFEITVVAPPTAVVAPPGYYILFVVHRGVPSKGVWVKIQ